MDKHKVTNMNATEIAILLTTCNKYNPGTQTFKLQSIVGLANNSNSSTQSTLKMNLLNMNTGNIPISSAQTAVTIQLEVPREIASCYPTKFIPPGTRFIVSFSGGDITKPIIVGRDF